MKKKRDLYFIGIGPGDPELLTLKAVRLIKECDVLFFPAGKKTKGDSIALKIVGDIIDIDKKQISFLHFPMVKGAEKIVSAAEPSAEVIDKELSEDKTGVFITVGCSTIYSTAGNLFVTLKNKDINIHFIPGISSINATASAAGFPLVYSEEKLAVLPATYSRDRIESCIDDFETVVLMKVHSSIEIIRELLDKKDFLNTSFLVERATTGEEKVLCMSDIPEGYKPHYMSSLLIKKKYGE
jgi:precorrin-2/cobalt-factor-2 C20-methyltransferase